MASGHDTEQQLQHVLAVPLPAQGHLNPLMRFCQLLAKLHPGFIITFVDFDPFHARLEQVHHSPPPHHPHHTPADAPSDSPLIRRVSIPIDGLNFSNDFNVSFREFFAAMPSMGPYLEQLILSLNRQGPRVTCLLSDFNITVPTQDIADKFGIPRIVLYPCSAACMLYIHYLSQEDDSRRISIQGVMEALAQAPAKRGEVFSHALPGLPTLFYEDLVHFRHVTDDSEFLMETHTKAWEICNARAHGAAVDSFMDLEKFTFHTLLQASRCPIFDVGLWSAEPLSQGNTTSLWKEDKSCMAWLDQQPTTSVLYISFGSITLLSRSQLEEFQEGLISSGQRFLWVFRPNLVHGIDHSSYTANIVAKSNGKGIVIDWAPQFEVLTHPSVGGFLTHCGWNSITESIINGVPMLCWPYFGDQPLNARYITDEWKVGLRFKATRQEESNGIVERDEVEKVIRVLMESEEGRMTRTNARDLKDKCCQCFSERGSSTIKLKALVESLLHYDSTK